MNSKRSLLLLAGLLPIGALILVLIRHPSVDKERPMVITAPPATIQARVSQTTSDRVRKHSEQEPGVIELPEFGRIPYARHRVVRVAELMKHLHDDDAFRSFMMTSPNVAMEVYEDEKGYLEFLAHNRGRFRSQPKDVEALQSMAKWGVVITPAFKSTFRMDDDEFVSILLKEIETKLTVEAQRGYPERIKELTLWPVTVEYVEKYAGTEEKGVKFPAIMVRYSEGIPSSDYYYKGPLILEETYVRRWRVYKYVKPGAGDQKGYLSEVAGESRLEPRLDLPSAGAPNK